MRIVHNHLKCLEQRELVQHGGHFTVPGDAVEHLDDAVVRQRRVGGVASQQRAVGADDLAVSEPAVRWRQITLYLKKERRIE